MQYLVDTQALLWWLTSPKKIHIKADPFDRLLIIQAKLHDLVIITNNSKIMEYPVITLAA